MKTFALIVLLTATGCAHKELPSGNQAEATSQIQRWVPIGTPLADAIRTMEQRGFTTMVVDHGGTYLDCEYRSKESILNPVFGVRTCIFSCDGREDFRDAGAHISERPIACRPT